jgi:transposase InsO family protein
LEPKLPELPKPPASELLPPSPDELLRCQVVAELRSKLAGGKTLEDAAAEISARTHFIIHTGEAVAVSKRSVYRWWSKFKAEGWPGLRTGRRQAPRLYLALPEKLLGFLREEKKLDRYASVPELLRRARELELVGADEAFDRVTVWRACRRLGLPLRRVPGKREVDARRFAYPHRMMMVLADGKHFRASPRRTKRVVLFFLDDATRKGLGCVVGTSECTQLFLRGLHKVICKHGQMDSLFLDRGPGFKSDDTYSACRALDINLILGTAAYPEGHGKIERFNQTAVSAVLRGLCAADVDDACPALELRLEHFLEYQYNLRPHEALGQCTPLARWDADTRPLRFPESEAALREKLVITELRKVSKDNVVPVGGVDFEVPRGHADTSLRVRRNLLSEELFVLHDGRLVQLHPVDLAANAVARRAALGAPPPDDDEGTPRTAASIAFARHLGPVVGPDGGFLPPTRSPTDGDEHD